jgi:hypothetical protein
MGLAADIFYGALLLLLLLCVTSICNLYITLHYHYGLLAP